MYLQYFQMTMQYPNDKHRENYFLSINFYYKVLMLIHIFLFYNKRYQNHLKM
jgi:hypothetical protein